MRQILVFLMFLFLAPKAAPIYVAGLVVLWLIQRARQPKQWKPTKEQEAEFRRDLAAHEERLMRQGPTIIVPAASFYADLEAIRPLEDHGGADAAR